LRKIINQFKPGYFLFILFLDFIILNFLISLNKEFFSNLLSSFFTTFLILSILIFLMLSIALLFQEKPSPFIYSSTILSPIILLSFTNGESTNLSFLFPLSLVLSLSLIFFLILKETLPYHIKKPARIVGIIILSYFIIFTLVNIYRFNNLCFFNPQDFAIYNQTFWNTIHGRLFENSTYGSNFACHNSPFYFPLIPFYLLFPHPLTLSILKTLLLSLSVIPFYLILKDIFKENIPCLFLGLAFLLFPFLVSQNFTPPHEISFLPFFLLFSFYYYKKGNFSAFLIFLIFTLSIKENLSLVAISLGIYSLFSKKSLRWVLIPLLLGIGWGISSLLIIRHFQKIYQPPSVSAWTFEVIKLRYLPQKGESLFSSILRGLSYSNLAQSYFLNSVSRLLKPLGVILPFLSPVTFLALPEFLLNSLSDRPANFSVFMHYNIITSCFLLIGVAEGIKKLTKFRLMKKLNLREEILKTLISIFIFSSIIIHTSYWLTSGILSCKHNKKYIETVKEALALIPREASVSVPSDLAVWVSARKKYSLLKERRLESYNYILTNTKKLEWLNLNKYVNIFQKGEIFLFRKARKF